MILCQTCVWRDPCAYRKVVYPKATTCPEYIPESDHCVENLNEYEPEEEFVQPDAA